VVRISKYSSSYIGLQPKKNQKEGAPYSSLDFSCMSDDLIKHFCNSSLHKRWNLSQAREGTLNRSKSLFVKLLITFFDNVDVTLLMVIFHLTTDPVLQIMWRNVQKFLTPSRRLHICTLLRNNFRCTLQHFANKRNTPGPGVGERPMWGAVLIARVSWLPKRQLTLHYLIAFNGL